MTTINEKLTAFLRDILTENALSICVTKDCAYLDDCEKRDTFCLDVIIKCLKQ